MSKVDRDSIFYSIIKGDNELVILVISLFLYKYHVFGTVKQRQIENALIP